MKTLLFLMKYLKIILLPFLILLYLFLLLRGKKNLREESIKESEEIKKQLFDEDVEILEFDYTKTGKMCFCMKGRLSDGTDVTIYKQKYLNDYVSHQLINPKEYRIGDIIACKCYKDNDDDIAFIK